jgi:hypothetical protein
LGFVWTQKERWKNYAANTLGKFCEKRLTLKKVTSKRQMQPMPLKSSQRKIRYRSFPQSIFEPRRRQSLIENFLHINCLSTAFVFRKLLSA